MANKGYASRAFEEELKNVGIGLLRPVRKDEAPRAGAEFLRQLRRSIEAVFDTLKDQLGLECHGGRTPAGVTVRILQKLLAVTAAIRHNHVTN